MLGFRGWHERGYLPHRDDPGLTQFVTFRLRDSIPSSLRSEWTALLQIEKDEERRAQMEALLDKGGGECLLLRPEIGILVDSVLRFYHGKRYDMRAWTVMPNHVHALFTVANIPMSVIVADWKEYTAREANKILGRRGHFWAESGWDTYMRDAAHELNVRHYIEGNPVKAQLVCAAREWPFGSARFRDEQGTLHL